MAAQPPPEPQLGKQPSFLMDIDAMRPMLSLPLDGSGPQMSFSSNGSITTSTSTGLLTDKWDKYVTPTAAATEKETRNPPHYHTPTTRLLRLTIMG